MAYTPGIAGIACGAMLLYLGASTTMQAKRTQPDDTRGQRLRRFDMLAGVGIALFGLTAGVPGLPDLLRGAGMLVMIGISVYAFVTRRAAHAERGDAAGTA